MREKENLLRSWLSRKALTEIKTELGLEKWVKFRLVEKSEQGILVSQMIARQLDRIFKRNTIFKYIFTIIISHVLIQTVK